MDVSVIIVSYNALSVLVDCLASLEQHDWGATQREIIVVDNGSTDGSVEFLRSQQGLTFIATGENLGFAGGNNVGVQAAQGKYVLLLNSDTLLRPGALRILLDAAAANPRAGIVGPRLLNRDLSIQGPCARALPSGWWVLMHQLFLDKVFSRTLWFGGQSRHWATRTEPTNVGSISGAAMLLEREFYQLLGGLDTHFFMYYEDTDLCKRSWDLGRPVLYEPRSEIIHLWGGSTRNRVWGHLITHESLFRYFRKHQPGYVPFLRFVLMLGSCLRLVLWSVVAPVKRKEAAERLAMAIGVLRIAWAGGGVVFP